MSQRHPSDIAEIVVEIRKRQEEIDRYLAQLNTISGMDVSRQSNSDVGNHSTSVITDGTVEMPGASTIVPQPEFSDDSIPPAGAEAVLQANSGAAPSMDPPQPNWPLESSDSGEPSSVPVLEELLGADTEECNQMQLALHPALVSRPLHSLDEGLSKEDTDELASKCKLPDSLVTPAVNDENEAIMSDSAIGKMEDHNTGVCLRCGNGDIVYSFGDGKQLDVDSSWGLKNYKVVLCLLENDSYFPKYFRLEDLSENDEDQNKLIEFANERNSLHNWIRDDNLNEVKKYVSKKKSEYFYNDYGSAARTALKCKKWKIYAYLQSIGVNLSSYESHEWERLSDLEKNELRDIMHCYFSTSEDSHISYIISKLKINPQNCCDKRKKIIKDYFDILNRIEGVSIILKAIQYVDNLEIVIDLNCESVNKICPGASDSEKGRTLHKMGNIYIAAGGKRSDNEVLGTIAHELTHMAMELIFKNQTDPYCKSDCDSKEELERLEIWIQENIAEVKETPAETLLRAFDYKPEEIICELVARIPHILAQYADGETWLESNVTNLWTHYKNKIIPECEKFIDTSFLLKQKSLNRKWNENEGEIMNLIKSCLFFENIDKVKNFLGNQDGKMFALITNYTWLGLMRVLQGMYGADYLETYDNFLVFKLENLIKNIEDAEYLFNSEATEALIIECPDIIVKESKVLVGIERMIKIVKMKENKKLIFIMKEEENKYLKKILGKQNLNDVFIKEKDEKFSAWDLDDNSREKILDKNVSFQEKELKLGNLINNDEDLLKCVDEELIQKFLEGQKIKIGSTPFGFSNLEGAYADIVQEIDSAALFHEIKSSNGIFLFCGMNESGQKKELAECLNQEIDVSNTGGLNNIENEILNNKRIITPSEEVTEDGFKKFCSHNPKNKIYFLKKEEDKSKFMLIKFYNPDFYFKREFKKYVKIVINEKILEPGNKPSDTFILDEDKDNKNQTRTNSPNVKLLETQEIEKELKKLKELRKAGHVLKFENNEMIWNRSQGSLSGLRVWIDEKQSEKPKIGENELLLTIRDEKVVIFADDPGMGKSTTITNLYEIGIKKEMEKISNTHWVIRINLKDHLNAIKNIGMCEKLCDVTKFLAEVDKSLKSNISKTLLEVALTKKFHKSLLIIFDGFDELLDENDRKKIVALLKFLKEETECKFWVTTRLHFKEYLEDELLTFAISFVPVEDDGVKTKFIKHYLKYRLKLLLNKEKYDEVFKDFTELEEESILSIYAKAFIGKTKSIFTGDIGRFIGTPLQLHLLLEYSVAPFRKWLENSINNPDFSYIGNNLLEVYEGFFNRKYEIYFKKKNIFEEQAKSFMKDLFGKVFEELAESLAQNKKMTKTVTNHQDLLLLLGITKLQDENLEFVHFTFREYFYAQSLIRNFTDQPDEALSTFFISQILIKKQYQIIRNFIDDSLGRTDIREALKNRTKEFIELLIKEPSQIFHIAIQENNNNIFNFLINFDYPKSAFYNILKGRSSNWPLLNLATELKNDFASELITKMISKLDSSERYILLNNGNKNGGTVLHLALEENNKVAADQILNLVSNFHLTQQNEFLKSVNKYGETVLHLAIEAKMNNIITRILKLVSEFSKQQQFELLSITDEHKLTVLHFAVGYAPPTFRRIIQMISEFTLNQLYQLLSSVNKYRQTVFHVAVRINKSLNPLIKMASKFNLARQYELLKMADKDGLNLVHIAAMYANRATFDQIIEMILKFDLHEQYEMLTAVNNHKQTVFHLAVEKKNNIAIDGFLELASKFNLDERYKLFSTDVKYGGTMLQVAVICKNDFALNRVIKMASKLSLDQQCRIFGIDGCFGGTALHSAVLFANESALSCIFNKIAEFSLDQKFELFSFNNIERGTVLHSALIENNQNIFNLIIKIVLEFDLEQQYKIVSTVSKFRGTVLHIAIEKRNADAINKMIDIASKFTLNQQYKLLSLPDKNGRTILEELKANNCSDIYELMYKTPKNISVRKNSI